MFQILYIRNGSDDDLNRNSGFFGENDDDGSASDDSEFGDGDVHQQAESNFEHADYKNPMLRQNNRSRLDANTLKALMKLKDVSGGKKKSQKIKMPNGNWQISTSSAPTAALAKKGTRGLLSDSGHEFENLLALRKGLKDT